MAVANNARLLMTVGYYDSNGKQQSVEFVIPKPGEDSPNFESLTIDSNFTWPAQNRLGRSPAMQFTGPGEEQLVVEGRLFPHLFGGMETLDKLREMGIAGVPLLIMRHYPYTNSDGQTAMRGSIVGIGRQSSMPTRFRWVLKRLKRHDKKIGSTHVANQIDFTAEFSAYGEDPGSVIAPFTVSNPDGTSGSTSGQTGTSGSTSGQNSSGG